MFETPNSSCESLINHCWWNACGGTSIRPTSKSCRLPLMPARWRMVEGLVDHGALRREDYGSTITESEDGLDIGEHLRPLRELSIPYSWCVQASNAYKCYSEASPPFNSGVVDSKHQDQVDRCGIGVGGSGYPNFVTTSLQPGDSAVHAAITSQSSLLSFLFNNTTKIIQWKFQALGPGAEKTNP